VITTDLKGTSHCSIPPQNDYSLFVRRSGGQADAKIFHDPAEVVARAAALNAELGLQLQPGFEVFVPKHGTALHTNEWTFLRKDGSRFPVLLTVSALHRDGEIFGYLEDRGSSRAATQRANVARERTILARGDGQYPAMIGTGTRISLAFRQ